jgi:hypothetical protein
MPTKIIHVLFLYLAAHYAYAAAGFVPANATIGSHLQVSGTVKLTEPAPEAVTVTLKSSDPARLRLAKRQDEAGSESIVLEVKPGFDETPEFWMQALADEGEATYTSTAAGFSPGKGTVTLMPSAIAIAGPFRAPRFQTTTGAAPTPISLYSVRLNSQLKYAEQQLLAGGASLNLDVTSSDGKVGMIVSPLTLPAGSSTIGTMFKPSAAGSTNLSLKQPAGFTIPSEFAAVMAVVRMPGIAITGDVIIGENLQVGAAIGLGESAPRGGTVITLTSDSPELLLSPEATKVGSKSLTITIAEGGFNARFYLQALGKSGIVTYSASARGYVSRTSKIGLAPSGIVMMPAHNGPPDEAELLRKESGTELPAFLSHLSKKKTSPIGIWTAQLDPVTLRSADITVQPVRAGMSLTIQVENRDPGIGTVTTPVTIQGGSDYAVVEFTPLRPGSTVLSAITPEGFTKSANSTSVKAIVKE